MGGECFGNDCEVCGEHDRAICGHDPADWATCETCGDVHRKGAPCPLCTDTPKGGA